MLIRKAFFYWQFIAVIVLPLWLVVGWPIFGAGGWKVLGVFFGAVVLGIALLVVSLLFYARREVRAIRAVSWVDAAVLTVWHALIISVGFYAAASPWLSILVILVGIGAFWFAVWELYDAAKRRVRAVIDEIEIAAKPDYLRAPGGTGPAAAGPGARSAGFGTKPDPHEVIVITERPAEH
ncbi:MFS transporter [Glaciibacter sp. 2TAF33]|uniref:MFS transporter n=1 Tax=Glaciibacter sp. 2TAF33 TaxID=3233015 RepID=UPI003F92763D